MRKMVTSDKIIYIERRNFISNERQVEKIDSKRDIHKPFIYINTSQTGKDINNTNTEENESVDFSINSYDGSHRSNTNTFRNEINNPTASKTINVYKISTSNVESKFKEYVEKEKYDVLKLKYDQLKEKYNKMRRQEKNWRSSYFDVLKESIHFDETLKNLIEENRIHQEYIISLENKLNRLLNSSNRITENFHNNIRQLKIIDFTNPGTNVNINNNNISNTLLKNYNEIINDYKQQIEILAEEKENLSTNMSISRHQQLQNTLKLEEMQNRILFMEQARLEDIKILQNVKKETA
jgi:hypothetical protein